MLAAEIFNNDFFRVWLLFLSDLSENELVGPIPPILGNLSYTGKLLVSSVSPVFSLKQYSFSINTFWLRLSSDIYMAINLLEKYHQNLGTWRNLATCKWLFSDVDNILLQLVWNTIWGLELFPCRQLNDNELVGTIPAELGKLEELFEL